MNTIQTNIKVLRKEARLSQEEFANAIGEDVETIILWEKGKLEPTKEQITKMCPVLRIHLEDFLERDILKERNEAGKKMKSKDRKTYDWFYGSKTSMAFYVSYLVLLPTILIIAYFIFRNIFNNLPEEFINQEFKNLYIWIYTLISGGIITAIYLLIYLFKNRIIRFQYWYIFILTTLISLIILFSTILTIVIYPYAFYKGIIKKGKNR